MRPLSSPVCMPKVRRLYQTASIHRVRRGRHAGLAMVEVRDPLRYLYPGENNVLASDANGLQYSISFYWSTQWTALTARSSACCRRIQRSPSPMSPRRWGCRRRRAGGASRSSRKRVSSSAGWRFSIRCRINTRVTVFVSIRTNSHSHEWLRGSRKSSRNFPEVIEFYRMSGDVDYLLRVVVPDIAAYDAFYKRLIAKYRDPRRLLVLRHGADQVHDGTAARLYGARQGERRRPMLPPRRLVRSSRASREDVSQRLPPIAWTSL